MMGLLEVTAQAGKPARFPGREDLAGAQPGPGDARGSCLPGFTDRTDGPAEQTLPVSADISGEGRGARIPLPPEDGSPLRALLEMADRLAAAWVLWAVSLFADTDAVLGYINNPEEAADADAA